MSTVRKTKIVATIGPASRSREILRDLILAGVNVFRLNFSHGSHESHTEALNDIRHVADELQITVAVLQDLSGPKIRITSILEDYVIIPDGGEITLYLSDSSKSSSSEIFVEGLDPATFLTPGETVLLADGIIVLEVLRTENRGVVCRVVKGGRLRSRVGIAFPDSTVDIPATTQKDLTDLEWGMKHEVDFVAISFVQNASDIVGLRERMQQREFCPKIIAKIERKLALTNIDEIIQVADGVMVARGDLGLEVPLERLPLLQRDLIEKSNHRGIPVIVATQMLHSMISSVRPTRAEVSDVAAAVMSGADAVMLSEETAIGEHPVEAVRYLSRIALEAEKSFEFEEYKYRLRDADRETVPDAISYAACAAAVKIGASAIIACSRTGTSARLLAKYRPQKPLYGVSTSAEACRRMVLNWGVIPLLIGKVNDRADEVAESIRLIKERENLGSGSRVIITGGLTANMPGSTSVMQIKEF
jgi:pyruvate kinase